MKIEPKQFSLEQKTILIIVDWFYPGYKAGGPIQSTLNLAYALKDKFRIKILTTDTDLGETKPYENTVSGRWINNVDPKISCFYLKKSELSLIKLKEIILSEKADFVYLNHMFSPRLVIYPLWLKYSGSLKSRVIVSPRGALFKSALSVKPWKKYPFLGLLQALKIKKAITFHATNDRERNAIEHFFPKSKIVVADNLPKASQPKYFEITKTPGELRCVFIARIVPIKNLLYLLEILKKVKAEVHFSIVGPDEDKDYWRRCCEIIETFNSNIKVEYLGAVNNEMLTEVIRRHHLFVLPTEGENFGHSIFESLLSGRPVLISDQTPWQNLSNMKVGWDVSLGDKDLFLEKLEEAASWNQIDFNTWSNSAWEYASEFIRDPKRIEAYQILFS